MKKRIKLALICLASSIVTSCAARINDNNPAISNSSGGTSQAITSSSNTDASQPVDKVTLTLNFNDGSPNSPKIAEYNKGDAVDIPDPTYGTPTFPTIYTFDGWVNQNNEKVTMPFIIDENTILTATWKESKAIETVTLDYAGGTGGAATQDIQYGEKYTLPVPTKLGYSFLGWFNGTTQVTDAKGDSLKPFESTSSVTFTAHWSTMSVTVTLDYDGGVEGAKTQRLTYGQRFKLPVSNKTGYIFNGWYDGNTPMIDREGNGLNTWNLTSDTTLKANYTLRKIDLDIWNGKALLQRKQYDVTMHLEDVLKEVTKDVTVPVWGWYKNNSLNEFVNSFEDLVIDSDNHANIYLKTAEGITVVGDVITKVDNAKIPADLDLTNLFYQGKRVAGIGDRAFYKCTTLKSITIPSDVVSLGVSAFEGCSLLETANLPEGMTELKKWAFYFCSSLKTVNIPASIKTIGWAAFGECKSLTSIELPEGLTTIDSFAFSYNTSLTSINLPSTLTSIGENAFNNCSSLAAIFIPQNVVSMGDEVFNGCAQLTINCAIAQPSGTPAGWSETWNPSNRPVNWGQKA